MVVIWQPLMASVLFQNPDLQYPAIHAPLALEWGSDLASGAARYQALDRLAEMI